MNKILTILTIATFGCCLQIQKATAAPAYPYKVTVKTDNGKKVEVSLRGDEYTKYAITNDGYSILNSSEGWWYAKQSDDGKTVKSPFKLMAKEDETAELQDYKDSCPKGLIPTRNESAYTKRAADTVTRRTSGKITGERHALVILMQYIDAPFSKTHEDFDRLFNQTGYNANGATGSVRDFYSFASQGQLDYVSDIYGPYTAAHPMKYYGGNSVYGGTDTNPLELCLEAMMSLPKGIDFSKYDNDGDGIVDNVHIIYAGYGEEAGASADAIWAHEYPRRISLQNEIGVILAGYSCSPELKGNTGKDITNIGVACHELGHALGADDYYDTNYATRGQYEGTGKWDLMASGSWNDQGRTPANFNPYVRSEVFGWNQQKTLNQDEQITIPSWTENSVPTTVYKIETGRTGDYFLLENRQKQGFDAAIPGEGMMIYHIHPDIDTHHSANNVNASHPQCLYPVCASGSRPAEKYYGNIDSDGCPFPGSTGKKAFTPTTSPAATAWDGSDAKVSISNITIDSSDGSISFATTKETTTEPDPITPPDEKTIIYKESFESNISDRFTVASVFGQDTWRTYKAGDFVLNGDYIPKATDGESILMVHISKGGSINETELTSQYIDVTPGARHTMTFDVYCNATTTLENKIFSLYIEDNSTERIVHSLTNKTDGWRTVEVPFTPLGKEIRYKMNACINTGGVYVDNIRIINEDSYTNISTLHHESDCEHPLEVFRTDGSIIDGKHIKQLKSGIYIMRNTNKAYKIMIAD